MYDNYGGMGFMMWLWIIVGVLLMVALIIWIMKQSKKT